MTLISSSDLTYMQATELTAMASAGIIYRPSYTSSPLGNQTETWSQVTQNSQFPLSDYWQAVLMQNNFYLLLESAPDDVYVTPCDIWPISRNDREKSGKNQEISEGQFYISLPYNASVDVADIMDIDGKTYEITFVPADQSWLTNLRVEARNYNLSIKTK